MKKMLKQQHKKKQQRAADRNNKSVIFKNSKSEIGNTEVGNARS